MLKILPSNGVPIPCTKGLIINTLHPDIKFTLDIEQNVEQNK